MRRTAEVVLTIIGAFFYLIGMFFAGVMNTVFKTEEFRNDFLNDPAINDLSAEDSQMALDMFDSLGSFMVVIIVIGIIAIIAGIVAMILFKGDNKPKVAGIILLVVGILTLQLFYIIPGIMGLVRKKKLEDDTFASVQ
ncbi:hypothetical protein GGQ92_001933 [Gracilibacillus halotolerans]|uniref:DUF4064 domain-containing protein n=1 Tax=Gracilibacillus halotolerans TaxID=74386 RepID=A0A841RNG3_9BACI|nr:DUF4064 domain-containing protein [Gracilibacillus halotolerans]MBB6513143.1 hypothetical protein [Gracilibacillus halotolerans]